MEEARAEHDAFAAALRAEGAEVVYLEDLVAEVFDAMPQVREAFLDQYLAEAGVSGQILPVLRAYFNALDDNRAFVRKTMAGVTRAEVELPRVSSVTLAGLVSAETESELVVNPMPNLYFTRDPFAVVGEGVSINRMYSATRNRETIYGEYVFRYHPRYRAAPALLPAQRVVPHRGRRRVGAEREDRGGGDLPAHAGSGDRRAGAARVLGSGLAR